MPDINNLPRLAQFLEIERGDSIFPKELVIEMSKEYKTLSLRGSELPHSVLAELPLPIYSIFRKHICNYIIFNKLNSNLLWTTIY